MPINKSQGGKGTPTSEFQHGLLFLPGNSVLTETCQGLMGTSEIYLPFGVFGDFHFLLISGP